jgi:hypothetical protein
VDPSTRTRRVERILQFVRTHAFDWNNQTDRFDPPGSGSERGCWR